MNITVMGGVYREYCAWPKQVSLLGSAGRAALCIVQLSKQTSVELISSFAKSDESRIAESFAFTGCKVTNHPAEHTTEFLYDHPLATPIIYPNAAHFTELPLFEADSPNIEHALLFGMYEKTPVLSAKNVIYDPQNTHCPHLYSEKGAKAENLIYVLNRRELTLLFKRHNAESEKSIEVMANWLSNYETTSAVIVKCGPKGAFVYCDHEHSEWVPAYQTHKVSPIGSGDSFVAAFTHYHYARGLDVIESTKMASAATAFYVEKGTMTADSNIASFVDTLLPHQFDGEIKRKKVYLAGPFFNMGQMWLINQCKACLEAAGMDVFSPYHELGIGPAEEVAPEDVKAIEECDVLYALFDDHDPGTLFEIGYAIKANKPVVIYSEKSSDEHLKMYEGTGCLIERDFATSIYRVSWM